MRIKYQSCKGSSTSPDGGGIFYDGGQYIFDTKPVFPEA
jgi:hypothetical protein